MDFIKLGDRRVDPVSPRFTGRLSRTVLINEKPVDAFKHRRDAAKLLKYGRLVATTRFHSVKYMGIRASGVKRQTSGVERHTSAALFSRTGDTECDMLPGAMADEPLILSIDTSDLVLGVDVSAGGESVGRRVLAEPRVHASLLTPTIVAVLNESGITMGDLDGVAVAMGPGSYTGLRIGVSSAKGLAYALDIPLMSISTLQAMAVACVVDTKDALITCLISRRGEIYAQVWDVSGEAFALTEVAAIPIAAVRQFLEDTGRASFAVRGSGTDRLLDGMPDSGSPSVRRVHAEACRPVVDGIARLAKRKFAKGLFEDVARSEPVYLRDFVAKRGGSPFPAVKNR